VQISDGRFHDIHVLDMLQFEPGAFYVVDRGYQDFARFYAIHQAGAFFVTRAKVRKDARRVYSMPVDRATGIMCDQRVIQAKPYGLAHYPEHFRRIRYTDPESGKKLIVWPHDSGATLTLTHAQLDALVLGLPWQRIGQAGVITVL
jgi:hypothetical protein